MKSIETIVSENIKKILKEHNINQADLAKIAGVSESTVGKWVLEKASPRMGSIEKIANYFNLPKSYILSEENVVAESTVQYSVSNSYEYNYFPTAISAGLPFDVDGMTESEKISVPNSLMGRWARDEDVYLTKIYGDSMDKVMRDGSIIAIKPMPIESIKDGDIVVFSDSHEYSVKHYYKHGDKIVFRPNSNNAAHHEQHYKTTDNIEIHGKVVMWIVTTD